MMDTRAGSDHYAQGWNDALADMEQIYNALTCASFAIKCLRDGIDISDKLPDTIQRIDALLARLAAGVKTDS